MEEIFDFLRSLRPELEKECLDYLRSVVEREDVKKGKILLKPGRVCRKLYFIKTGLLRCYCKIGDKEVTEWFFWLGHTVVSVQSWHTQTPGSRYIQALQDSELYSITYDKLQEAYERFHEFSMVGLILTTRYLVIWDQLLELMHLPKAMDRFQWMMKHQPEALQRVPQKYLASWLRMEPETLSRMRGKH